MNAEKLKTTVAAELGEGPSEVLESALEVLEVSKASPETMEELKAIEEMVLTMEAIGFTSTHIAEMLAESLHITLEQAMFLMVVARLSVLEGLDA